MVELKNIQPLGEMKSIRGTSSRTPEVTIEVKRIPALVQLFAKKGQEKALFKKLNFSTVAGQVSQTTEFTAIPQAPNQWLLVSKKEEGSAFSDNLMKQIVSIGYVSEQSDSRVCIRVFGPKARELMSRGCRLDLHSSIVSAGYCAQTTMGHIGVLLHVVEDDPVYDLYVYSGFARSFWHWFTEKSQQFNCEIIGD